MQQLQQFFGVNDIIEVHPDQMKVAERRMKGRRDRAMAAAEKLGVKFSDKRKQLEKLQREMKELEVKVTAQKQEIDEANFYLAKMELAREEMATEAARLKII